MKIIRTIAKNTLFLIVGQIVSIISVYLYTIYAARYLGAEGFGVLSFAIAFTGISCLIVDLGMNILTTREVSRNNLLADKYIGNIIVIKTVLTIITFLFTILVINILKYPYQTILVVYLITLSTIISSFNNTFTSLFQAFQRMEYISFGKVIYNVLMLLGALFAINRDLNLIYFAVIYCIVSLFSLGYSLYVCINNFLVPKIEIDLHFWKNLLKESMPFWMTSIFVIIYFRMDMIMLSIMRGDEVVGWYAASYRIIDGLSTIPSLLMTVMFPVFSKYYLDSRKSLEIAFRKSFKYLIIITIPIGVGTTILAGDIISLFYGSEYVPSVSALKILIWASVLSFINWTPSTILNSTNEQRTLMIITSIGAFLNMSLNYLLIPSLSYNGAGIATVVTEFVVGLLIIFHIQKTHSIIHLLLNSIFRSSIAAFAMGTFLLIFENLSVFLRLTIASILYFFCLFAVNGIGKEDLNLFNQIRS